MTTSATDNRCCVWGGAPLANPWLYRVAPFHAGDAAAFIRKSDGSTVFIVRDIELDRARRTRLADETRTPADFAPSGGLSADRDIATAQATAECLRRLGEREVWADRSLPMVYAHAIMEAGLNLRCDPMLGVMERRAKSQREIDALRTAQRKTERAIEEACRRIARAAANAEGILEENGEPLTSERVRADINVALLKMGMGICESIVAGGPAGADCHNRGDGPLRTGEPVIIDVFPMDPASRYYGDCTRTVVHGGEGNAPEQIPAMHDAVLEAKRAAINATRAGATGEAVHSAACEAFTSRGYAIGLAPGDAAKETNRQPRYVHGTGHGIGLDVHEPPLLHEGGPELIAGDALTIEPGLYARGLGGVRVEDMVIVTETGCENLNSIPEGLFWE